MIDDYIIIYDPRYYHLLNKNKWIILDSSIVYSKIMNSKIDIFIVEYMYDDKPYFTSDFCNKFLPPISIKKTNKKLLQHIFCIFCNDIIEQIITYLPDKYILLVKLILYSLI